VKYRTHLLSALVGVRNHLVHGFVIVHARDDDDLDLQASAGGDLVATLDVAVVTVGRDRCSSSGKGR
jgi:hypothetical protein